MVKTKLQIYDSSIISVEKDLILNNFIRTIFTFEKIIYCFVQIAANRVIIQYNQL